MKITIINMMKENYHILCLNAGSSSIKFAIYQYQNRLSESLLYQGELEKIGEPKGKVWITGKQQIFLELSFKNYEIALKYLISQLEKLQIPKLDAAGHRLVHGGPFFFRPTQLTSKVIIELKKYIPFAPLHLPKEIELIETMQKLFPDLLQVGCFDTNFHADMPQTAKQLPLTKKLYEKGVRKYGFHGLSYEYIFEVLKSPRDQKIIIAHLGNGISLCAIKEGKSIDTTMGFTPTGGCMMGTRCGDLDPGVIIHLQEELGYSLPEIEKLVNNQSGLLGISELTSDMQTLLEKKANNVNAQNAIDLFVYHIQKQIGGLAAILEGLDQLVFTGGIGENASAVRSQICSKLHFLGVRLDEEKNRSFKEGIISKEKATPLVQVIKTEEDLMLARHVKRFIKEGAYEVSQ